MNAAALALTSFIAVQHGEGGHIPASVASTQNEGVRPTSHCGTPHLSRYGDRSLSARTAALGLTFVLQALIVAVVILNLHRQAKVSPSRDITVVHLLSDSASDPAAKFVRRVPTIEQRAITAPAVPPRPIAAASVKLPAADVREAIAQPPEEAGGRNDDTLVQVTQAYQRVLSARLETMRSYPRPALLKGYQGAGAVRFRIDREGRLLENSIEISTGQSSLDRAALALIQRATPFPPIPAPLPDELAITMPIRFLIIDPNLNLAAR